MVHPAAYEPDVAMTLNSLAVLHKNTQRLADAEAEYAEALEIYRRLAARSPEAHEPDMAMTLNNLAYLHSTMQRQADAEAEYSEVLEIYRRLAAGSPDAYEKNLADTEKDYAFLLKAMGRGAKAREYMREAAELYKKCLNRTDFPLLLRHYVEARVASWSPAKLWGHRVILLGGVALVVWFVVWLVAR